MNEVKTNRPFKTPKQVLVKQTSVYPVQTSVQTGVQTPDLTNFSVMERAIIWILLNTDMKLSYDDIAAMTRIPGVGKKTAQKIVLELKGRLIPEAIPGGLAAVSSLDTEVIDALTAMGFSIVEAQAALQSIPRDTPEDIEERVRLALAYFA